MAELKYSPDMVILDNTVRCNQSCYFCWRAKEGEVARMTKIAEHKDMPFDTYKAIIDDASQYKHIRRLGMCGPMGEPMLVSDMAERCEYAGDRFGILINTNGTLIHKHNVDKILKYAAQVLVSVDSVDRETYGKIHGNEAHLELVIANVEMLYKRKNELKAKCTVAVRFTEGQHNKGQAQAVQEYFQGKCDSVRVKREHSFMDTMPIHFSSQGAHNCNQPAGNVNFNLDGYMTTCCVNWHLEPTFGNIHNSSIKEMWEGAEFTDWRTTRMKTTCLNCGGLGGR